MIKPVSIATAKGPHPVEAKPLRLYVGARQERFFIHDDAAEGAILSHYASGQRVGALAPIKLTAAVRWGTGGTITDREAAKRLIAKVIERNGADKALAVMNAAPRINA